MKFLLLILSISTVFAANNRLAKKVEYKTYFGYCPSTVAGKLTLELVKIFDEKRSLKAVKENIIKNKLNEKYFLSEYKISYDPIKDLIKFNFNCPKALMKVQIYKDNGDEFYTAVLVDNGKLFDPTYEVLLRSEKILRKKLPHLAIPVKAMESNLHIDITRLLTKVDNDFKKKISEMIVNDNEELTVILSVRNRPSSAFLGKDYWSEKLSKLERVISYMGKKRRVPAVINLTNSKKVVVKFPGSK